MGRPALPHGMILYPEITELRAAYETAKVNAEAEIRAAVAVRVAGHRRALVAAMRAAREQGASIAKIGEAYGSKDARTIYTLLDEAPAAPTLTPADPSLGQDVRAYWAESTDEIVVVRDIPVTAWTYPPEKADPVPAPVGTTLHKRRGHWEWNTPAERALYAELLYGKGNTNGNAE